MVEWITSFVHSTGYFGIAVLMFVETLFPPIPSELILPFAGFTAGQGQVSLLGIILVSTLGSMVGTLVLFSIAKLLHAEHIESFIDKRGRYVGVSKKDFHRAQAWFDRNSYMAIFLCRLIPGIRSLISIPAGVRRMDLLRFTGISLLGTAVWNTLLTIGGYVLGENYHVIESKIGPIGKLVLLGIFLVVAAVLAYRMVVTCKAPKSPVR